MSFPISLTWANPTEGTCPSTFDEAIALYRTLLTGKVLSSYIPYVIGSTTPAVEDQDKAWIRLDAAGRPLGTFCFYAGSWRRQYNGKFNEITMFHGNPSLFFDGTGRGLTTSEWDGWSICNGQNGTPNLTDQFIIAAHLDNSDGDVGYSGGRWRTKVSGGILPSGGAAEVTLTVDQIPKDAEAELLADSFADTDGHVVRDPAGKLWGEHSVATGDAGDAGVVTLIEGAGAFTPDPVSILPPYYAMCYCVFSGYT